MDLNAAAVAPSADTRPPPNVTYDPKHVCFRNARGARMAITFDRRWFPRAGEFPIYVPVKDTDAAGVTGRDLNDREQGLVDALMPPRRDTTPIGYEAVSAEEQRRHSEAATREARKAAIMRDEETPRYPEPPLAARQAALDRATALANVDMRVAEERTMAVLDLPEQVKLAAELDAAADAMDAAGKGWEGSDVQAEMHRALDGVDAADHDPVNHPRHYTSHPSGVECITITRHMGFNLGNALKYIWRADLKNGIEDLEKAAWYIADEIAKRKA